MTRSSLTPARRLVQTIRLSWPARWLIVRLRLRALRRGEDPAGATLLLHHLAWCLVMLWPGPTLVPQAAGTRSSLRLFIGHGGDLALLAVYLPLLALTTIAVLRVTLKQPLIRGSLLSVAAISVGLAIVYLASNPFSALAWDSSIRALTALWAYSACDEE